MTKVKAPPKEWVYELMDGPESIGIFKTPESARTHFETHPDGDPSIKWATRFRHLPDEGRTCNRGKSPFSFIEIVYRELRP